MKICIEEGCSNPQYGGQLCKYHQFRRRMRGGDLYKPNTAKRKTIPKVSKKRKEQLKSYKQISQETWDEAVIKGNNICIFCGQRMDHRENCHHADGRDNNKLTDKDYLTNAHNDCHLFYHRATYEQLSETYWWESYLERIKAIDERLWREELKKKEKSQLDFDITE